MHLLLKPRNAKIDKELILAFYRDNAGGMYCFNGKKTYGVRPDSDELKTDEPYVLWCSTWVKEPFNIGKNFFWLAGPNTSFVPLEEGEYINSMIRCLSHSGGLSLLKYIINLETGPFIYFDEGSFHYNPSDYKKYGGWLSTTDIVKNKISPIITPQHHPKGVPTLPIKASSGSTVYVWERAEFITPTTGALELFAKYSEIPQCVKQINCQVKHLPLNSRLKSLDLQEGDLIVAIQCKNESIFSPTPSEVQGFLNTRNFTELKIRIYRLDLSGKGVTEMFVLMHPNLTTPKIKPPPLLPGQRDWIYRSICDHQPGLHTPFEREDYKSQLELLDDSSLLAQHGAEKCGWERILS